jgi:uncharacterized protein
LGEPLGAIALLLAFCDLLSWMLVKLLHVDPSTAYLAASPGGVDAAAVVAASTKVDAPFVMIVQTVRVVAPLAVGPRVAQWAATALKAKSQTAAPRAPLDLGDMD